MRTLSSLSEEPVGQTSARETLVNKSCFSLTSQYGADVSLCIKDFRFLIFQFSSIDDFQPVY